MLRNGGEVCLYPQEGGRWNEIEEKRRSYEEGAERRVKGKGWNRRKRTRRGRIMKRDRRLACALCLEGP
jgi:hypothetical protein